MGSVFIPGPTGDIVTTMGTIAIIALHTGSTTVDTTGDIGTVGAIVESDFDTLFGRMGSSCYRIVNII